MYRAVLKRNEIYYFTRKTKFEVVQALACGTDTREQYYLERKMKDGTWKRIEMPMGDKY